MEDKRKSERVPKKIKSEVHGEEMVTYSSAVDISKNGIFISTPEPPAEGSEVNLNITSPDGDTINLKGTVRWVREDENEDRKAGMGVEFTECSPEKTDSIDKIIRSSD